MIAATIGESGVMAVDRLRYVFKFGVMSCSTNQNE